ncbi:uncharacterized protein IL334_004010 [Kwoniella shivajii]|uniref:Glycosyltransferase family 18 catalytic domain-containing protein n=1 Tax=Kwoniella shivajii TaxID=564305 RepID=A0ABZ1CZ60_9TREE|nr:hypothetical protein IL334_004010 [Kwoniella shivajii]
MPVPRWTRPPKINIPISRTYSQKRNLCFMVLALFTILFLLGLLHPTVQHGPLEHLDRLKEWSTDKAQNLVQVLPEEGWGGTVKDWLDIPHNESGECKGWDPKSLEENDPVDCLKARQYRQTMRVLEREEKSEHDHWYFTKQHNIDTLRDLTFCFLPITDANWMPCHEKPLIVSGWWYTAEVITGATTGEVIWQGSVVKQLKMLGYSFIAVGPYVNWIEVAEMMPDVYHLLWSSDLDTVSCVTDPRCIAKEHYIPPEDAEDLSIGVPDEERGVIPIWALNIVDYWGARPREMSNNHYWWGLSEDGDWSYHPLGQEWIATPWPLPGNHYHLPYTIEEYCMKMPITPHEERKDAALLLAKRSAYFHYPYVSPASFWTNLSQIPDLELLSTVEEEEGKPLPEGLQTMGRQSREDYEVLVGNVKALVGMGAPPISPSIYSSLCQATPVVIPYFQEDYRMDGWWLYSSWSQHGPAIAIGEPYVYKYYAQNYTDLEHAVRRAMATPIDRFIPEDMKLPYALSQLSKYLSRDLKGMFDKVILDNEGNIPRLKKGVQERCYELKRCRDPLTKGRVPSTPPDRVTRHVIEI